MKHTGWYVTKLFFSSFFLLQPSSICFWTYASAWVFHFYRSFAIRNQLRLTPFLISSIQRFCGLTLLLVSHFHTLFTAFQPEIPKCSEKGQNIPMSRFGLGSQICHREQSRDNCQIIVWLVKRGITEHSLCF